MRKKRRWEGKIGEEVWWLNRNKKGEASVDRASKSELKNTIKQRQKGGKSKNIDREFG